nr:B-cell receptor CD22-like isoform X2 [Paramormyrops kingsleyae]
MGGGDPLNFWGLILVVLPGVLSGDWSVKYPMSPICAVRGSAVVIPCEYDYPSGYSVQDVMWCHNSECLGQPPYVYHTDKTEIKAEYKDRAEYLGNTEKNCTLKIKDITGTDAGVYRFRLTTDRQVGSWTGQPGVTLKVDELKLVMTSSGGNGTLREGDSVNLTCDTGNCSHSQLEFTWFKDNQHLPETQSTLQFDPVSYHHSGKYWCALKGYRETESDVILLNVQSKSNPTFLFIVVGISMAILAITLVIIICMMKRKTTLLSVEDNQGGRTKNCATDSHSDNYATLDVRNSSPNYDTLTVVKSAANERNHVHQKPTNHQIYENTVYGV